MARPQGRPPAEHVWRDGGWYHTVTGKPFNEEVYIAGVRRRQAECERRLALTTSQSCYKKSSLVIGSGIGAFMRSTGIFAFRVGEKHGFRAWRGTEHGQHAREVRLLVRARNHIKGVLEVARG